MYISKEAEVSNPETKLKIIDSSNNNNNTELVPRPGERVKVSHQGGELKRLIQTV